MLLFTLASAGATVLVMLAFLSVPALNACSGDGRGLFTCFRDLIGERFDRGGEAVAPEVPSPGAAIPAVVATLPEAVIEPIPEAVVDAAAEVAADPVHEDAPELPALEAEVAPNVAAVPEPDAIAVPVEPTAADVEPAEPEPLPEPSEIAARPELEPSPEPEGATTAEAVAEPEPDPVPTSSEVAALPGLEPLPEAVPVAEIAPVTVVAPKPIDPDAPATPQDLPAMAETGEASVAIAERAAADVAAAIAAADAAEPVLSPEASETADAVVETPAATPAAPMAVAGTPEAMAPTDLPDPEPLPAPPLVVADLPAPKALPGSSRSLGPQSGVASGPAAPVADQSVVMPAMPMPVPDAEPLLPVADEAGEAATGTTAAVLADVPDDAVELVPTETSSVGEIEPEGDAALVSAVPEVLLPPPVLPPALAPVPDTVVPAVQVPPLEDAPTAAPPMVDPLAVPEQPAAAAEPEAVQIADDAVPRLAEPETELDVVGRELVPQPVEAETEVATPLAPPAELPAPEQPFDLAGIDAPPELELPAAVAPPVLPPTIDAVEMDGMFAFIAGDGPAGALIRLYVDEELAGESPVEGGRWLVEGVELFTRSSQLIRIDAVQPETGELLSSSSLSFELELPDEMPEAMEDEPPAAAPDGALTTEADPAPMIIAGTPAGGEPVAVELAPVAPVAADVAELPPLRPVVPKGETASVTILGAPADTGSAILPLADADAASVTTLPSRLPVLVADFTPPEPATPRVMLRDEVPDDYEAWHFVAGKAIIRRGDTLWAIAHRFYGRGIRYGTIYRANRDVIARPSRIYPGQVVDLPLVYED